MCNIREMIDMTRDYVEEWKFIGIALGFSVDVLDVIETQHRRHSFDCLTALLEDWLKGESSRFIPTRGKMTAALQSYLVKNSDEGM